MIRPPSLVKQYDEYWSEDPAFEQAPAHPGDSASAEQLAAFKKAEAEYTTKLFAAWDTGNWAPLRIEGGGEPTKFVMRPIPSSAGALLADMMQAQRGENEVYTLAFRIALVGVSNLEGAKVAPVNDERFGRIASLSWMDDVGITGAMGVRLLRELGSRAMSRASSLGPK